MKILINGTLPFAPAPQTGINGVMANVPTTPGSHTPARFWLQRTFRRMPARIAPKDFITVFERKALE